MEQSCEAEAMPFGVRFGVSELPVSAASNLVTFGDQILGVWSIEIGLVWCFVTCCDVSPVSSLAG